VFFLPFLLLLQLLPQAAGIIGQQNVVSLAYVCLFDVLPGACCWSNTTLTLSGVCIGDCFSPHAIWRSYLAFCLSVCALVCTFAYLLVYLVACLYVCMYVRMYVCMYACMCVKKIIYENTKKSLKKFTRGLRLQREVDYFARGDWDSAWGLSALKRLEG